MEAMLAKERCGIHLCSVNDQVMAPNLILKMNQSGLRLS